MFKLSLAFSAALVAGQVTLTQYCSALATKCPGHSLNAANCEIVMNGTAVGTANEEKVDSLECRYKFLNNVAFNGTNACQYAGPTGGGLCGTVLDTTCRVATAVCVPGGSAAYATEGDCKTALTAVQHQWGNQYGADAAAEDSLECRAYHAIASVITGDQVHCGHYTVNNTSPCKGAIRPNPSLYCETLQRSCGSGTAANAQFAQAGECSVVAMGYPTSSTDDARPANGNNSLGCRQYHSWAAAASPAVHCEHAGPSGAGVCGTRRDAWASILNAAPCSDPHVDLFVKSLNSTLIDLFVPVGTVTPAQPYSTTFDTDKNTQICRIYHLGVASLLPSGPNGHCTHGAVSGGGACGSFVPNLCGFIEKVCGFGTATWQFADSAACTTGLATGGAANITNGVPKPLDTGFNTHECRFYHAGVAASFLPGGMNAGANGADTQRQLHCSHVLRNTVAGGCNPGNATLAPSKAPTANGTKAPTAAPKNSAGTLSAVASVAVLFFSL